MTEEQKPKQKKTAVKEVQMQEESVLSQSEILKLREAETAAAEHKALRDEFAKAALTGLLAHHGNFNLRSVADAAYQYADFMLDIRDDSSR